MEFNKEDIEALLRLAAEALFENKRISSLPLGQIATQVREKYPAVGGEDDQAEKFGCYRTQRMIERQSIDFVRASNWLDLYYKTGGRVDLRAKEGPFGLEANGRKSPSIQDPLQSQFRNPG